MSETKKRLSLTAMQWPAASYLTAALLSALAYFLSARVGYLLSIRGVVAIWPASGVMLGLLLAMRRRFWPALVLGGIAASIASDLTSGNRVTFALAASLANALEWVAAAALIRWRSSGPLTFGTLRELIAFVVLGPVLSNAATSLIGASVLIGWSNTDYWRAWAVWWVGDGLGMLVVGPLILVWRGYLSRTIARGVGFMIEGTVLTLATIAVTLVGLRQHEMLSVGVYLVFPLMFWAALRRGPAGAAVTSFTIAAIATWYSALDIGPFAHPGVSGLAVGMQLYLFIAVTTLTALTAAAVTEERRESDRRMVESESRYRSVVNAVNDAIVTMTEDSRIVFASASVRQVFGYEPEELVGESVTVLMHESYRQRHLDGLARYIATGLKRTSWRALSVVGRHRAGHDVPLEISFGELVLDGRRHFTGILRDVSDKRAAEEALKTAQARMHFALEAANVGVWELNIRTGEAFWSETCEVMHGLQKGSFARTLDAFVEAIHPDDRKSTVASAEQAIKTHSDAHLEYRTVQADGQVRLIRSRGRFSYDENGVPTRGAGVAMDFTEQRQLQEQLQQSQKMEAIGQLAGGVAHDFNNLLTAIHGYGGIVLDGMDKNSPQARDIGEILAAADRAKSLTRQLLAFSRRQMIEPKVFELGVTLKQMEPMLRRLIGEDISLEVQSHSPVGRVRADPGQIEQVILNLAINARDAMPRGGSLTIQVEDADPRELARAGAAEVPGLKLVVRDTGVGMDAKTRSHIFEPFFTTKQQGTGLGLATVHGIVRQSGGAIVVESEPGRGACFTAYLPRVDAEPTTAEQPHPVPQAMASATVLVVEDNDALRRLAARMLSGAGYTVLAAGSPREALALLDRESVGVDILLTDVVLPEMSGPSLAELVAVRRKNMRVVYMSGYTDDEVLRRGVLAGELRLIQKPFTRNELLSKIAGA